MELKQQFGPLVYKSLVDNFPACPELAVSHSLYVSGGNGQGKAANLIRQLQMSNMGYDAVICTVAADNAKQINILSSTGWKKVAQFYNMCTEHVVEIWFNELKITEG